jgi:hypothetical protein
MAAVGLDAIFDELNKDLIYMINSASSVGDSNAFFRAVGMREMLVNNPVDFVKKYALSSASDSYGYFYGRPEAEKYKNLLEKEIKFLTDNGVSSTEIAPIFQNSVKAGQERYVYDQKTYGGSMWDDLMQTLPIVLSFAAPGIGTAIGTSLGATGVAATALGNAVIGGTIAEASGGDFIEGALASGAGALAGGYIAPELSSTLGSETAGRAITGGLLAEAQGGDFLQGATSGAISGAVADAKLAAAEEYLASQPSGYGAYESNLPTEQAVLDAIAAEQPTFTISDTTFTPDYSLTTGAPVIPEMGAQGIQVPTINEVIDVVNQPVDYSLPIPDSGLGLQMPTAPNLESMGGGQGITVPVSGGVLTEAGVIPPDYSYALGDPNSFINQPAPGSGVKIEEVVEKPMTQEELTKKLSEIDLAKTAANLAAGALAAGAVANLASGSEDTQTGYPIVPIPADWTSPVYASTPWQAPTPIDFGSRELLKGTQWENPVSLSSLINSMNVQPMYEMPDFMQTFNAPTTVATTDIIGNLNGKPMSISDIISGIQSGQTYSS